MTNIADTRKIAEKIVERLTGSKYQQIDNFTQSKKSEAVSDIERELIAYRDQQIEKDAKIAQGTYIDGDKNLDTLERAALMRTDIVHAIRAQSSKEGKL